MIHTCRQSPKFKTLVRRIRPLIGDCIVDAESVAVAILERLWHATAVGAKRGNIGKFDNELIAEECGWMGDADQLISSLVECGFLDECKEHRLVVHDWDEHSPKHVKGVVKRQGGFAKAVTRAAPQPPLRESGCEPLESVPSSGPRVSYLGSTTQGCDPKSATLSPQPPNQTKPNLTKPNQTKRFCPEPPEPVAEHDDASGFEFPVKGNPKVWALAKSKLDEWRETYDGLDVDAELAKARQWCRDNGQKRKTARGMLKFLSNWLMRANDRGGFDVLTKAEQQRREHEKTLAEIREKRERNEAAEQSRAEAEAMKGPPQKRVNGISKIGGEKVGDGQASASFHQQLNKLLCEEQQG